MVKTSGGALLLSLKLDQDSAKPLSTQLCVALRELILSGALRAGDRLPASRTVARDLGVSRTTVIEAFARLQAEGLIEARVGAGSYVSQVLEGRRPSPAVAPAEPGETRLPRLSRTMTQRAGAFFDRLPHEPRAFTTAMPAFDAFPVALWSRYVAKHWRDRRDVVLGYGDSQGYMPLRRAIAAHLRANRAIACEPEQVFVVNGAQHGFQLIASILLDPGDPVWIENPGAIGARNCFAAAGAELVPVPVDGEGLDVEAGLALEPGFRLAFVTPAHQQPMGCTMSLRRRLALLAAADEADAWIVEDDYDGEFCYGGRPPATLKSTDSAGRVIYVGTFSKSLFPALRLGYVLVPPGLVAVFDKVMRCFVPGVPSNPQAVVSDFMDEGQFATHIRRMRKLYAERHDALLAAARERLSGLLEVVPTGTGLHTVGLLAEGLDEAEAATRAWDRGITVVPLQRFALAPIDARGLVLGFSGVGPTELRRGVAVLAELLEGMKAGTERRVAARA
ncbi:transcriptional regulator, GntR family [Tistlia consotensis]|uniref:Transcriptional regulator, GntR family n=1 Tax=Tistlia consotensis USBA 355 TaxID=560819 RepID=A0A1Y6CPD6_9PROT|nr:PLP-dependent aminotransferase family protein [Tistlia consotensis]SMF80792.1 transcriptional regulator, GntR family [Tistlia consotensis USBA 355]SNS21654.1 transcriptional regulator, GntR family [Tistlia consotensis]